MVPEADRRAREAEGAREAKGLTDDPRYGPALEAVEQYVQLGGRFVWGDLTPELIAQDARARARRS